MNTTDCDDSEDIVRAIRTSDWDKHHNRWSSNLFTGPNTSVSRLKILSPNKLFVIFCKDLHKPPAHKVIKIGKINIGSLKKLGNDFQIDHRKKSIKITVTPEEIKGDPIYSDNPAHAVINEKLPRTLAFDIIKSLTITEAPSCLLMTIKYKVVGLVIILITSIVFYSLH